MNKINDQTDKCTQVSKDFGDIVDTAFPKLDILNYYPYGSNISYSYWLCGEVNLTKYYLDARNKERTEKDLVLSILRETSRAMNYLMVNHSDDSWSRQRVEAFALHRLFNNGWIGWEKKPLKGLSEEEKEKLYALHDKRYDLVTNKIMKDQRKHVRSQQRTPEELKEYDDLDLKHKLYNRKKYGIYEVKYLPLMQYGNCSNVPKVLYTKKELCAINLMVTCAFENLC